MSIEIKNQDAEDYLQTLEDNSIDLILTDPPYIISKETGMDKFKKKNENKTINNTLEYNWDEYYNKNKTTIDEKTQTETLKRTKNIKETIKKQIKKIYLKDNTDLIWEDYYNKNKEEIDNKITIEFNKQIKKKTIKIIEKFKKNYEKYSTIYGKKFSYSTDFGEWDKEFTIDKLTKIVKLFHQKLRKGGTCIIFFDFWKLAQLKEIMSSIKKTKKGNFIGFDKFRIIHWIKTGTPPLNQKVNYLSNCIEYAILGVKKTDKHNKSTFNSKYDKGVYEYPIPRGKIRTHKTQKNLDMFIELIEKHSNEGDVVLDTFLGSGTTAFACKELNRNFKGCEKDKNFYDIILKNINLYPRKKRKIKI